MGETSVLASGERKAHAMLAAESKDIPPNTTASLQRTRMTERSPPFPVTLKGRPKGLTAASAKVAVMARAVIACVISMKTGRVRERDTHPL